MPLSNGARCAYTAALLFWTSLPLCSAENITNVPGYKLRSGVSSVPAPLRVAPDQGWLGIDGQWNTFSLRIGSQKTIAQVLPSTSSQQIWVVNRKGCTWNSGNKTNPTEEFSDDCDQSRGYVFDPKDSSSWETEGFYELWVGGNFGLEGRGDYGFDNVGLGIPGEEGPTVQNTTIGSLINYDHWLGHLGLHPKPTNFSKDMVDVPPVPSYMTKLFEQGSIPSLSFGYTTGVQYRDTTFLGSLTLGGYDSSRYIPNNVSFEFAPDNERELVVSLVNLRASMNNQTGIDLSPDTTAFEKAFGLTYDNTTQLYLVDDLLHETLKAHNPNVTFTLSQPYNRTETVEITLPYAAFDLQADYPYHGLKAKTRYFPLRRADNNTQWALGRAFLQEAYLTVDWDRSRFSVYQCDWTYGKAPEIMPIVARRYTEESSEDQSKSTNGVLIGVVVGCVFLVVFLATAIVGYFWQAEAARKASPTDTDDDPSSPTSEKGPNVFLKAELPGVSNVYRHEMGMSGKEKVSVEIAEVEDTGRPVYEMLGDIPTPQEAASRQLSEKESMLVREKNINGVDLTAGVQVTSPTARLAPVASLNDIATVATSLPSSIVSPVTPRAPRDGAYLEASDGVSPLPPYRVQRDGRSVEDLFSPISPLDAPPTTDSSRRRFSYES
ncbi:hypothetical protein E8E13_008241 [Curvularia kusanoi]|uniref:Peptidase A1 domain-containing protein n=1 Tax=Curvularia kusanoi TaxID=90978 RepID=A0A9P4TL49_CURKU|nr:hypothetical protein E8E13_008241 [Curvularia kusanoi]